MNRSMPTIDPILPFARLNSPHRFGRAARPKAALTSAFLALVLWLWSLSALAENVLRIGVLAASDTASASHKWQPLADYLRKSLPDTAVQLQDLDFDGLAEAVALQKLDIVVTNAGEYLKLSHDIGVSSP